MKTNTPLIQARCLIVEIVEKDMVWENAQCTEKQVTIIIIKLLWLIRDNIISRACIGHKRKYMG